MEKLAIITINEPSINTAYKLLDHLRPLSEDYEITIFHRNDSSIEGVQDNTRPYNSMEELLDSIWDDYSVLVFLVATGIVVRKIAPRLKSKTTDPAVLVMTLDLKKVIPLVSGHIGGANAFSDRLTDLIPKCINFVTTATDQTNTFAFDLFAKEEGYNIVNIRDLAKVSNSLINGRPVCVLTYPAIMEKIKIVKGYRDELFKFYDLSNPAMQIDTNSEWVVISPIPFLRDHHQAPLVIQVPFIYLGLGMDKGTPMEILFKAVNYFLFEHNLRLEDVKGLASFTAKTDEKGLNDLSKKLNLPLSFYSEGEINSLEGVFSKSRASDFFNIKGVAEPSAILASKQKTLFLRKHVYQATTVAAAF